MAIPKESNESRLTPSIIAFTLAVCCVVLNPYSDEIKCTEESIKKRYTVFLVSIIYFIVKFIMRWILTYNLLIVTIKQQTSPKGNWYCIYSKWFK